MRGSIDWQVREVFSAINSIGESKHEAKAAIREAAEAIGKSANWEVMGKNLGCHGISTYDDYRATSKAAFAFVKNMYGVQDITRLESHHIAAFLEHKVESGGRGGDGVARATFSTYASSLSKLEVALNKYSQDHGLGREYKFDFADVRKYAAKSLGKANDSSRAYKDPQALVAATTGKYELMARLQYESGCRIDEISRLRSDQMQGLKFDPDFKGEVRGFFVVSGKGGYERPASCKPDTYERVLAVQSSNLGVMRTNEGKYRGNLKQAALKTGQTYTGSHGLRWNFCQELHSSLQKQGHSYEASLSKCSNRVGHHRSDIAHRYQK